MLYNLTTIMAFLHQEILAHKSEKPFKNMRLKYNTVW